MSEPKKMLEEKIQQAIDAQIKQNEHIKVLKQQTESLEQENINLHTHIANSQQHTLELTQKIVELEDFIKNQNIQIQGMQYELEKWYKIRKKLSPIRFLYRLVKRKKTSEQLSEQVKDDICTDTESASSVEDNICILTPNIDTTKPIEQYEASVSVVIPTFNGGNDICRLLGMLSQQIGVRDIEVTIVDSGSKDETVKNAKWYGAKVIEISHEDFSHSYARNLGAEHSKGDFLLFMTQDAFPTDEYWLYKMLTPIMEGKIVALSPMEKDRPEGDLKYKVDNWFHVQYLGVDKYDKVCSLPEQKDFNSMRQNAQLSDITCLIRREVFMKYQYQGNFAEDLDMGLRLINDGEKIALLSSVKVIHSHTRASGYYVKRNLVDVGTIKKMLPDYPMMQYTSETLIEKLSDDYASVLAFLSEIEGIAPQGCSMKDYCEAISVCSRKENKLLSAEDDYGDETIRSVIEALDIRSEIENRVGQDIVLPSEFVSYINDAMISYIITKGVELDHKVAREITDTIYKCFASYMGVHLAEYSFFHEEKDSIMEIISSLCRGV